MVTKLAIRDSEKAHLFDEVRVRQASERTPEKIVEYIRGQLESAGKLTDDIRARLTLALDEPDKLFDVMRAHLTEHEQLVYGMWPGADFVDAGEAELIRDFIVRTYREDLQGFSIAMIFQKAVPPVNRRGRLGTAAKVPGKMHYLSSVDAVITLDYFRWLHLTDRDRQRLVHHELEHLEVDDGLKLRTHDFEDFTSIVRLYGLRSESESFSTDGEVAAVLSGAQLSLLDDEVGQQPFREEVARAFDDAGILAPDGNVEVRRGRKPAAVEA